MEQAHGGTDWGGFAFWLFIAACVVAGTWEKIRKNAEKHATLRTIIEKTGVVDEAKLRELFNPLTTSAAPPGGGYRVLRIAGVMIMIIAGGMGLAFLLLRVAGQVSHDASTGALCLSAAGFMFGLAFFVSSRYAAPPPDRGSGPAR